MGRITEEMKAKIREEYKKNPVFKDVAKKVGTDPRTVKSVIREDAGPKSEQEKAIEAYRLFNEGKTNYDVTLTLKLRQPQVELFRREYLRLKRLDDLDKAYETLQTGDLYLFLDLYQRMKREKIKPADCVVALKDFEELRDIQPTLAEAKENLNQTRMEQEHLQSEICALINETAAAKDERDVLKIELENMRQESADLENQITGLCSDKKMLRNVLDAVATNSELLKIAFMLIESADVFLQNKQKLVYLILEVVLASIRQDPSKLTLITDLPEVLISQDGPAQYRDACKRHHAELADTVFKKLREQMANEVLQDEIPTEIVRFNANLILSRYSRIIDLSNIKELVQRLDEMRISRDVGSSSFSEPNLDAGKIN